MQFHIDGTLPQQKSTIFVFGSNLAGRHGAGAALVAAQKFGAKYGIAYGRTGRCYAIPTKNSLLKTLELDLIKHNVEEFIEYASIYKGNFFVTRIGCGLAGYKDKQIAPMFTKLDNCSYPLQWKEYII
jgi:Na+-driven multidrug efflux pump